MVRNCILTLALAVAAVAALAAPRSADAATPIQNFRTYSYYGTLYNYYGYLYAYNAHSTALAYGFDDSETGYALYYGELYSYYAYLYGAAGYSNEFSDYITNAGDLSNAAWNYEYGAYSYVASSIVPQFPDAAVILDYLYYSYVYNLYAEIYYNYAVDAVN